MKILCPTHGVHFPEDFRPRCPVWQLWGLNSLKKENKRKVWDWMFALDIDAIAIEEKVAIDNQIRGIPIKEANWFAENVPGYKQWSDNKRKRFQEQWFKNTNPYWLPKHKSFWDKIRSYFR